MILMTHGIVGAAVGRFFPRNPLFAFIAGFISHFLIDAIPHWGYPLKSFSRDKENPADLMKADVVIGRDFAQDLIFIALDFIGGLVFAGYLFETKGNFPGASILVGTLGGMLPDALQFLYFKARIEPLKTFQRFHIWIHGNEILAGRNIIGLLSQASFAAAALISKLIIR